MVYETQDILLSLVDVFDNGDDLSSFEISADKDDEELVLIWQQIGWQIKPCTLTVQHREETK